MLPVVIVPKLNRGPDVFPPPLLPPLTTPPLDLEPPPLYDDPPPLYDPPEVELFENEPPLIRDIEELFLRELPP